MSSSVRPLARASRSAGYRADLIRAPTVIVEIKAVHEARHLTHPSAGHRSGL